MRELDVIRGDIGEAADRRITDGGVHSITVVAVWALDFQFDLTANSVCSSCSTSRQVHP